jgi:uncharacterized protein (DUF433 family)
VKRTQARAQNNLLIQIFGNTVYLYMEQINYKDYIEVDPEVRFGKPVIKGTRITVYDVLSWLALGMTHPEIISDFPQLTERQILACLAYAANKERVIKVA